MSTYRKNQQIDGETVYIVLSRRHVSQERDHGQMPLLEQLLPSLSVAHFHQVPVVRVVPVQPTRVLLRLPVRIRRRDREQGVLVVRVQQRLTLVAVEDRDVLLQELAHYVLAFLIAEERLLRGGDGHFFLDVETYGRREVYSVLRTTKTRNPRS